MLRFVVSFLMVFGSVFAASLPELDVRVIGGGYTTIEDHPYQVALLSQSKKLLCGGTIISKDIVVTAGQCVIDYEPSDIIICLGSTSYSSDGQKVAVKALKYHEKYNKYDDEYDVAIVQLAALVRQSSKIRFIELADVTPSSGAPAFVTGWGNADYHYDNTLRVVQLDILSLETCRSFPYSQNIRDTMICTNNSTKDACPGDEGGPLVAENKLVGIVSWRHSCGKSSLPSVYTDVAQMRSWILEAIQNIRDENLKKN